MAKIIWTKQSIKDLKSIFDYIALDSKYYAGRLIKRLVLRTDQLEVFPESGRIVPEKEDSNIREIIEGNYRIFFRFSRGVITILRVHNSARKIK